MDLVTGGSGFVGGHLVRALLAEGEEVRCLVHSGLGNLEGLPVESVRGDLTDLESLHRAVHGARRIFHCAADYRLYTTDPEEIYRTNVQGTRNLMRAAADAAVDRVVHTSSVGALGLKEGSTPADEETPVTLHDMIGHYKRSKFLAERVADDWARKGLPVVIVNPSTPVGELDIRPTPTGRILVDFLNRKMLAYVDTGLNFVDVKDVAEGHLLAARNGRIGEKYILGNRNLTLKQMLDILPAMTGIPAPQIKLPHWIPLTYATFSTSWARLRHGTPKVPLEGVRMSRHRMYFDASKAVHELGFPQTPVENALERAVVWFRENGYVRT